ncbi:MAG: hypothetical protein SFU56_22085 [Capsulimonadales bacterium]|nr:hypothetical protein [Capsulimonadales bacterium]
MVIPVRPPKTGGRAVFRFHFVFFAVFAIVTMFPNRVFAVPSWARMTGMPCLSCHVGGTSKLTAYGRDFQMRGHRMKPDMKLTRFAQLDGYLTLAARFRQNATEHSDGNTTLENASLFAGGPINSSLSFFTEYGGYIRTASGPSPARFNDAYLQYTGNATADRFWWVRAGRQYPFAIYAAGVGGRENLSRPRALSEKLGGFIPAAQRRTLGISGGADLGNGLRFEGGVTDGGSNDDSFRTPDDYGSFVTLEKEWDAFGSGIDLYAESGWQKGGGASFRRTGILARWVRSYESLSGALLEASGRPGSGLPIERPTGAFVTYSRNLLAETTSFVRYDSLDNLRNATERTRGMAFGLSQRIPNRGRIVLEWNRAISGRSNPNYFYIDTLLMY